MVDRYSITSRWDDVWFMNLPPLSKLLFDYICDNCSASGIIELNYPLWQTHTGLTKKEIRDALVTLQKNLLSDKKAKLWVKTHFFWQRMLPLNKSIPEHRVIITHLEKNLPKFNNAEEISEILNSVIDDVPIGFGKKNGTLRFVAPSYEEFSSYFKEVKPDTTKERIDNLFDHYVSCGWKVGKNPMKDWQAAIRKNKDNNYSVNGHQAGKSGEKTKSRSQTTFEVANSVHVSK